MTGNGGTAPGVDGAGVGDGRGSAAARRAGTGLAPAPAPAFVPAAGAVDAVAA